MSIPNRTSELVPSGELKNFMDELGRVTDRESFNSLMRRFDDSFLQRYQNKPIESRPKPQQPSYDPSYRRQEVQPTYPVPPNIQSEYHRYHSEGRIQRPATDLYPNQIKYYQEEPHSYYQNPNREILEDPYRVPMYQRSNPQEYEKPAGYIRTDYVNYQPPPPPVHPPPYSPQYYAGPQSNPYSQYPPYPSPNNQNPLQNRNPLQESMDLRRVKEEMLFQNRPEAKPLENLTLPPPRYEIPNPDPQPNYFQPSFKSFYSG